MRDTSADQSNRRRRSFVHRSYLRDSIVLWRFRGERDERHRPPGQRPCLLRGLAIKTSFGYAFGLDLDREIIFAQLHGSLASMVAHADRERAGLIADGWQAIEDRQEGSIH